MVDLAHWLLVFCTGVVFYVTGGIWFAQVVVYPLFGKVGEGEYVAYHKFYSSRIPRPVIFPGFALMISTLALPFLAPDSVPAWMPLAILACAVVAMYVIVAFEIPRHARLEKGGKQEAVIRELVLYNWPRTLSITGSAILTLMMLAATFQPA